jgi:hypothetical protein
VDLFAAASQGLELLRTARIDPAVPDRPEALILFSSGNEEDQSALVERANQLQVPIYTVLMIPIENSFYVPGLRQLAEGTAGEMFAEFEDDWEAQLARVLDDLTARRGQFAVTYRSASQSSAERTVTVQASGLVDSETYLVDPGQPTITLSLPDGQTIRRVETIANYQDPTLPVQPIEQTVVATLTWPAATRNLVQGELLVNEGSQPLPVSALSDSIRVTHAWNITQYSEGFSGTVRLQMRFTDELGIVSESNVLPVSIVYVAIEPTPTPPLPTPTPTPPPDEGLRLCTLENKTLDWICKPVNWLPLVSLLISLLAIGAVVFIFVNRSKLGGVPVLGPMVGKAEEFVDRLTHRWSSAVPKAYLYVVEGLEEGARKTFELFGETRLGRSPKFADISFQVNEANSPLSRLHCTIVEDNDEFYLRDEGSANGTHYNGIRLQEGEPGRIKLHDGDEIELGQIERGGLRLRFEYAKQTGSDDDARLTQPGQAENSA